MTDCRQYIEQIYLSKEVNTLIGKCSHESLQDDLRQELALALLQQPCDKIIDLKDRDKLLAFALKIVWNMATSSNSVFYTKFRKKDIQKLSNYLYSQMTGVDYSDSVHVASKAIVHKMQKGNITDHHEALLFNSYIELKSCDKVAKHYGIPKHHVQFVLAKVKQELKELIKNQ
jgi:hypothetical protein